MTALDGAGAGAAVVSHDAGHAAACGGDRMTRTDLDVLAAHGCDYAACANLAQVVLTHPHTGQYLLLVCAACAPRYRAMLRRLAAPRPVARANGAAASRRSSARVDARR